MALSASFSDTNQSLERKAGEGPLDFPVLIAAMIDLTSPNLSGSTTASK